MEFSTIITGSWNAFATKLTTFHPELMGAIVIFIVGWIIAKLVKSSMI